MRTFALLLSCLFVLGSSLSLSAGTKPLKIGDFTIDSICKGGIFFLDDGNFYRPESHEQYKATKDWQLGDKISVSKISGSNRFMLINTRTGQQSKMEGRIQDSCKQ